MSKRRSSKRQRNPRANGPPSAVQRPASEHFANPGKLLAVVVLIVSLAGFMGLWLKNYFARVVEDYDRTAPVLADKASVIPIPESLQTATTAELERILNLPAIFENDTRQVIDLQGWTARVDEALAELQSDFPSSAEAQHLVGLAYLRQKKSKLAEPSLRNSVQLAPENLQMRLDLAELLSELGRDQEGLEILLSNISDLTLTADYMFRLGALQQAVGKLAEAEQSLMRAAELSPDRFEQWLKLATVQMQRERYQQAEQSVQRALDLNQETAEVWQVFSRVLAVQGKIDEAKLAIESWQRLLARPNEPLSEEGFQVLHSESMARLFASSLRSMAILYAKHGQNDKAADLLQASLQLDSEDPGTLSSLLSLRRSLRDYQGALEYCGKLLQVASGDAIHYQNYANLAMELNDPLKAEVALRLGARRIPENGVLQLSLARFLLFLGKPDEAVAPAEAACRILETDDARKTLDTARSLASMP